MALLCLQPAVPAIVTCIVAAFTSSSPTTLTPPPARNQRLNSFKRIPHLTIEISLLPRKKPLPDLPPHALHKCPRGFIRPHAVRPHLHKGLHNALYRAIHLPPRFEQLIVRGRRTAKDVAVDRPALRVGEECERRVGVVVFDAEGAHDVCEEVGVCGIRDVTRDLV